MSSNDQEIIARFKEQERAQRISAEQARNEPAKPASINQTIVMSAMAICVTIAVVAYAMTPGAFWKPQDNVQEWCGDNGYNFTNWDSASCREAYRTDLQKSRDETAKRLMDQRGY